MAATMAATTTTPTMTAESDYAPFPPPILVPAECKTLVERIVWYSGLSIKDKAYNPNYYRILRKDIAEAKDSSALEFAKIPRNCSLRYDVFEELLRRADVDAIGRGIQAIFEAAYTRIDMKAASGTSLSSGEAKEKEVNKVYGEARKEIEILFTSPLTYGGNALHTLATGWCSSVFGPGHASEANESHYKLEERLTLARLCLCYGAKPGAKDCYDEDVLTCTKGHGNPRLVFKIPGLHDRLAKLFEAHGYGQAVKCDEIEDDEVDDVDDDEMSEY